MNKLILQIYSLDVFLSILELTSYIHNFIYIHIYLYIIVINISLYCTVFNIQYAYSSYEISFCLW